VSLPVKDFYYAPQKSSNDQLISMLHTTDGCTIEFTTPEDMFVAVGISSLSSIVPEIVTHRLPERVVIITLPWGSLE